MKVTIIPIVIGALGTFTQGLLKGLEDLEMRGRLETIQTTILLRMARILRRVLETSCRSGPSERPSAKSDVKNSLRVNNNNDNNDNNNNNNNYYYFDMNLYFRFFTILYWVLTQPLRRGIVAFT